MKKSVSVILQKRNKSQKEGVLTLRIIQDRKKTDKSLGIIIPQTLWNDNIERVRKTEKIDYNSINEKIEEILKNAQEIAPESKKEAKKDDKIDFLSYFKKEKDKSTYRTARKQNSLIMALEKFKPVIYFEDITADFILRFKNYMLNEKGLKMNTANRNLILLKTIINRGIKSETYSYLKHPYLNIKVPKETGREKFLTPDEVKRLITLELPERLKIIKLKFLFQTFCNGIRVSDLMLQRWININADRIIFTIFKGRKQEASIQLNDNMISILSDVILLQDKFKVIKGYDELLKADLTLREYLKIQSESSIKEFNLTKKNKYVYKEEKYINEEQKVLKHLKNNFALDIINNISKHKDFKNEFIFPGLQMEKFVNFDIKNPTMKHLNNMESATTVYNRQLKEIQEYLETNTTLTSHVARSTFANLLLDNQVDIYTISKALYHSSLKITEVYTAKFNRKKVDSDIERVIDKFNF